MISKSVSARIVWAVKRVIARMTSDVANAPHVRLDHKLARDYGFEPVGQAAIAAEVNAEFTAIGQPIRPELHPSETIAAVTVGDIVTRVRLRFGDAP